MADEEEKFQKRMLGNDPEVWAYALSQLKTPATVYLATSDAGGAHVRPVTVVKYEDEHYILTGTKDDKIAELRTDPRFEMVRLVEEGESQGSIRYKGEVEFVTDPELRRAVYEESKFGDAYFDSPDDPMLTMLHLTFEGANVMRPRSWEYEILTRE